MAILRTDIEKALDEIASQEEGMRFQGLALVLGKKRWPELIARQRKKDHGLDAYAPASLTQEKVGKGLAASITATLKKIAADAEAAKRSFSDLGQLLFVTPAKVGNADRKRWEEALQKDEGLQLHIIEREEIITFLMMPENASLCASFLYLPIDPEPQVADLVDRTRRAANAVAQTWARRTKGQPLINLTAVPLDVQGGESSEILSAEGIVHALSQSRRIVLEAPAGRGKTTTLVQIAQRPRSAVGTRFMVDLPAWTSSRRRILEYLAGIPAFQALGLTPADLARVHQAEPFVFLLNGWNEIAESTSAEADEALRVLERDFPSAGIIVATRTHHLMPPLPGALRLRLLPVASAQRTVYLAARLGAKAAELGARIAGDSLLDELTRTPFVLSEVVTLFEAGAAIPSTKLGVVAEVLRLHEQRAEHRNALQGAPLFGRQTDLLQALATGMTRRGAVTLPEPHARAIAAAVARMLTDRGQIEPVGAPVVLATLTAHHVLERVDYPGVSFQFEHQQLQEYYAALDVRARLFDLLHADQAARISFTADYVNDPAWAEPLRMVAETLAQQTGDDQSDRVRTDAGAKLVEMALEVDLVFAGELAHLCGPAVWDQVHGLVNERLRAVYTIGDEDYRQYALAAMLATDSGDFADVVVPLLSGQDQQTRLGTYRLRPDIRLSSLGPNWREEVRGWSEEARADLVSEILHHRIDDDVVMVATEDTASVKKAAVSALMWTGGDDALTKVLQTMDATMVDEIARASPDLVPAALRPRATAAMHQLIQTSTDHGVRLRTALELIRAGAAGLDSALRGALAALAGQAARDMGPHYIRRALEHLRSADAGWVSRWVAVQIAEGVLYEPEDWLRFVTTIPDDIVESCLQRLERENLNNHHFEGIIAVIVAHADARLAERVFARLRNLERVMGVERAHGHELEWQLTRQLTALYRHLPDDVAAAGIVSSVGTGDPLDVKVTTGLLNSVARSDGGPLHVTDDALKARLREYLKSSVPLVLAQEDASGEEKANLASSIAQIGEPGDMADLVTLIRADIERMRRTGGPRTSYAPWHMAAVLSLDSNGAEHVLIDVLSEPEYRSAAAAAMANAVAPHAERPFVRTLRYDAMWAAREGRVGPWGNERRRELFAAALKAEITRVREHSVGRPAHGATELAKALAAIDARGCAATILEVIARPGEWEHYTAVETAELLLMAGVVLPVSTAFSLVDSVLKRTERGMQQSDRYLLQRAIGLCPFVDDVAAGVAKIREVLGKRLLYGHERRELVAALGESRSDAAVDLLVELAADPPTWEQCADGVINALAALDTARARALLLGLVDPDADGIRLTRRLEREDVLVARLTELARRAPEAASRLRSLCERDLPEVPRQVLSRVMDWLGTPEAFAANLNLIDDAKPSPVPRGVWDQLEGAFIERRPYGENPGVFTRHARASNEMRVRLFRMTSQDAKRRVSAFRLLGQIESWRLEHGRPTDEPRHPDFTSGQPWPPRLP